MYFLLLSSVLVVSSFTKSIAFTATIFSSRCDGNLVPKTLASQNSKIAHDGYSTWERDLRDKNSLWDESIDFINSSFNDTSSDDTWLDEVIDTIQHNGFVYDPDPSDPPLYDVGPPPLKEVTFEDEMGKEVSLLVRCNENPQEMLVREGRALPPLTEEELNDPSMLITRDAAGEWEPTTFLKSVAAQMFHLYSDQQGHMNAQGVADWMTRSLGQDERFPVTRHDKRVLTTLTRFGEYGKGYITEANFLRLYREATVVAMDRNLHRQTAKKWKLNQPTVESVWRDIRNHGFLSPVELERNVQLAELDAKFEFRGDKAEMMDECEIVQGDVFEHATTHTPEPGDKAMSSHQLVKMAANNETPLYIRDGEFIYIDEDSCIGCKQCASAAPESFMMLDNGRARTFLQRNHASNAAAVATCPVNCMHRVSFDELQEHETARDRSIVSWREGQDASSGDTRRQEEIPLFVSRVASNNNRLSSYHQLKNRCFMSSDCPTRGCYQCPNFNRPGDNPFFQRKHKAAEHQRATTFMDSGKADKYRKFVDL